VKSAPFVVTSTVTYPGDMDELLLHTTDVSLTYSATTVVVLKRHLRYPSDADNAEKPLPDTVTGVPPSDTDDTGHTDDTAADTTYVYSTPLELNCCPFNDTSKRRGPTPDDAADAHSSRLLSTCRPTTVLLLSSKRHTRLDDSRKPAPNTLRRVPPDTGPSIGCTELTHKVE
jgi:hypothetical protein